MPRVSDDYRRARRDEIAQAAIRCLERKGVHDTSIADIVEESGLSTGAIYSHFTSKSELARYIVAEYLFPRLHELEHAADVRTPRDVLETMLKVFTDDGLPTRIVVQFWGEAATGGELRDEMMRTAARLRATIARALLPWARTRTGHHRMPQLRPWPWSAPVRSWRWRRATWRTARSSARATLRSTSTRSSPR